MTVRTYDWATLSHDALSGLDLSGAVAVLPLGATEQHGAHLPLSTDTDLAEGLFDAALERLTAEVTVLRLPAIAIGASAEHADRAGTLSVPAETLAQTLRSIGAGVAAAGVRRLVLLNAHGGNLAAMDIAALDLRQAHGMFVVKLHYPRLQIGPVDLPAAELAQGIHGGAVETAMMLHLHPGRVDRAAFPAVDAPAPGITASPGRVAPNGEAPWAWLAGDLDASGIAGDPRLADAALGERLVTGYGAAIADVLTEIASMDWPTDG
ncbi:creatininase family protein [Halofilum ochraceum]|uniref:creatininase family protein n=1 Tax=Halofilum ochraceum TaxID=1611323 RepID=UPI0008D9831B|nr:creatininase family protein [Halofilum ochraceum]